MNAMVEQAPIPASLLRCEANLRTMKGYEITTWRESRNG